MRICSEKGRFSILYFEIKLLLCLVSIGTQLCLGVVYLVLVGGHDLQHAEAVGQVLHYADVVEVHFELRLVVVDVQQLHFNPRHRCLQRVVHLSGLDLNRMHIQSILSFGIIIFS